MYLLRLGFRPWKQNPFAQFTAIFASGFLLFLFSFVFWIERELKPVIARFAAEKVVTAYIDPAALPTRDAAVWVDEIRVKLGSSAIQVDYLDSTQFLSQLEKTHPELANELKDFGPDLRSMVPSFLSFRGPIGKESLEQIRKIQGVESVDSSESRYAPVLDAFRALRRVSLGLSLGLFFASVMALLFVSKLNHEIHEDVVSLLRLLGAEHWKLKAPALISGLFSGLMAGSIALAFWGVAGNFLVREMRAFSPLLAEMQTPPLLFFFLTPAMGFVLGILMPLTPFSKGPSKAHPSAP